MATNQDIYIPLTKIVDNYGLINHTPEINTDEIRINIPEVNRPALQLAGFFEHLDKERVQIIGNILCRGNKPDEDMVAAGLRHGVPIMSTHFDTSRFNAELSRWLNVELAPCITRHGVLVDVYGEGVLIMGESGIGKSEAALELIKRGHRLVTDDVVEIRRVSAETLIGSSPAITKHFIELRGIGIIDVKALFGVESILDSASIDMVIQLEEWRRDKDYDRMGLDDQYTEFLGNKVICHKIPIRPGRNLAVIVEAAAVNHRQKRMGYNAARELYKRVQENMEKGD